jgi:hypothetical protein
MYSGCACQSLAFWHNWRAMNGTVRDMANKNMAQFYAPQTKIWEGGTKDEMRISNEALFHGSWPKLSTHVLEKYSKIRIASCGIHYESINRPKLTNSFRVPFKLGLMVE